MTSIQTDMLHPRFLISPSAPCSENQDGLDYLRTPPTCLEPDGPPASGGNDPNHSYAIALPATPSCKISSAPMVLISASTNNRSDPPVMPRISYINCEPQEQQNVSGLVCNGYLQSHPQAEVELTTHNNNPGIFWGERLWRGSTAFDALRGEGVNQQNQIGEESCGVSAGRVETRVGRAAVAASAGEIIPNYTQQFIRSSYYVDKCHKCFLCTWWVDKNFQICVRRVNEKELARFVLPTPWHRQEKHHL